MHSFGGHLNVTYFFFFYKLLETKWNFLLLSVCRAAGSSARGPGSATKCMSPCHAAPDLLTQEIELTPQPGPWGPTAVH